MSYPKKFTSMDDVKFVIRNYPKEVWEEDFKDLLARTQGYIILGKNPRWVGKSKEEKRFVVDPLYIDELKTISEDNIVWEDISPETHPPFPDDVYTFKYNGVKYLAQFGPLPYATIPWLDINYVSNAVLCMQEINDQLEEYEEGLKKATEGIVWVNDEGQEVDENDQVIKRLVDINSLNPFDGLTFEQLKRLEAILQQKLNPSSDEAAENIEQLTDEQGKENS
jgi:hypothetical protein